MTFCITGTLSRTRDEWVKAINENGGFVKSSVTSSLSYLIIGDEPGDTKLNAARRFGIRTITEDDLTRMIGRSPSRRPKVQEKPKEKGNRFSVLEL